MQLITAKLNSASWRAGVAVLGSRRSLWSLSVLLGLLCLAAGVRLGLLFSVPTHLPVVSFPAPAAQVERHYSLYPGAGSVPVDEAVEQLDVARINAVVVGIVSRAEGAWVNISLDGKTDRIYTIGDSLAPSVVVEAIVPDGVVVREQGVLRRIPLRSLVAEGAPAISVSSPALAVPTVTGDELDSTSAAELIDNLGVTAVINADGSTGLRVDSLDAQLPALGLSEGDVVVAVNGRPVAELMADARALADLRAEPQLAVTLRRDGSEQDISVDGAVISQWLGQ